MPTTLTGLLLFIVLLLPGFAYVVGRERYGPERHPSAFRETVAIVVTSVISEIAVLILFAIARSLWPSVTPDVGKLVRGGSAYLRDNYRELAIWGIGLLALAVALAYASSTPAVRQVAAKLPFLGPYAHERGGSAWWQLFRYEVKGRDVYVGCVLDDGSYVGGRLKTWNKSADDDPDREFVLMAPIIYRPPEDDEERNYPVSGLSVAARRIVTLFVSYMDKDRVTSSSVEAAGEAAQAPMASDQASPAPGLSSRLPA